MASGKRKAGEPDNAITDFRHEEAKRKNNPPAGLGSSYERLERNTKGYCYDPHRDPELVWAGKAEHTSFDVDLVSLHIHERISTCAILAAVRRPEPQLSLFGETRLPAEQEIEFYQHDVNWANRLILGDSLLVMNSLLVKEGMAGKVQMIYIDPPYGIQYRSNFQPRIDRRDVKDQDEDLTHEPEQIKAYRDTWRLGIHSYLTYLRDRLLLSRELLSDTGSIFVQINEENLHLVRSLLDEVLGRDNFVSVVSYATTGGFETSTLSRLGDYLLWYAKDRERLKYRQLFLVKSTETLKSGDYRYTCLSDGTVRLLTKEERQTIELLPEGLRVFRLDNMTSQGAASQPQPFEFQGQVYHPGIGKHWKARWPEGMECLGLAERLFAREGSLAYRRYLDDFPVLELTNMWGDTSIAGTKEGKWYAVQTNTKVVERCILMATDPGDLVFDPTCGSGTTAYCAERWGRRWITCDTSRVAVAIARERLLTTKFDYYELMESQRGPAGGFRYETVPHVTLESIAKNPEIDAIAAKYQADLDRVLADLNRVLRKNWREWEVPRHAEPKWPRGAAEAHERYWRLRRDKQREIDESIQRNAPQETLYDRPVTKKGVVRVSGPFTVEAIPVPVMEDPSQAPIPQYEVAEAQAQISDRGGDYVTTMLSLLKRQGGVLFPGARRMELQNLRALTQGLLHGEAEVQQNGRTARVAISFGPQYGPVTAFQVREAVPTARLNGYDLLILAGFSFDPEAQALIQRIPVSPLQVHFACISPDVLVGDLLKTTRASQIFTVFGQPDLGLDPQEGRKYVVELRGVDVYNPLTGDVEHARGEDVAAWFLDSDHDGKTFHICQAFFPGNPDAWDKLQRALKAKIEPESNCLPALAAASRIFFEQGAGQISRFRLP